MDGRWCRRFVLGRFEGFIFGGKGIGGRGRIVLGRLSLMYIDRLVTSTSNGDCCGEGMWKGMVGGEMELIGLGSG